MNLHMRATQIVKMKQFLHDLSPRVSGKKIKRVMYNFLYFFQVHHNHTMDILQAQILEMAHKLQ